MKIFKYPVSLGIALKEGHVVEMPVGAQITHLAKQDDQVCVWAMVDENEPLTGRHIRAVGTGWALGPFALLTPLGTIMDGPFVWHFFDGGEVDIHN